MSLLGGGTRAAVGRSSPCSSIDAATRGNGGRSKAPKAKACMRNAAVATAKMKRAMPKQSGDAPRGPFFTPRLLEEIRKI